MTETRRQDKIWSVQEAKAKLSEVLRRAHDDGPQIIGTKRRCVVIAEEAWRAAKPERMPLGRWLVERTPGGEPLDLPDRADPPRKTPFEQDA